MENENNENEIVETVMFTSMTKGMKWSFVDGSVGVLMGLMQTNCTPEKLVENFQKKSHLMYARNFVQRMGNFMFTRDSDDWWRNSTSGWKVSQYPMVCYEPYMTARGKTAPLVNNQTTLMANAKALAGRSEYHLKHTRIEYDVIEQALENWDDLKSAQILEESLAKVKTCQGWMEGRMHDFVTGENPVVDDTVKLEKLMVRALNDKIGRATERGTHHFHDRDFNDLNFIDYETLTVKKQTAFKEEDVEYVEKYMGVDGISVEVVDEARKNMEKDVRSMRRKEWKMARAWLDIAGPTLNALRALEGYYIEVDEDEEE